MKNILEPEPRQPVAAAEPGSSVKEIGMVYLVQLTDLEQKIRVWHDSGIVNFHSYDPQDVSQCMQSCRGCVLKKMLDEITTTRKALSDASK